ncbi:MAG: hypothetical protein DCC75_07170 [Proteobacteria bacterium]|nr:MAG: hypothetical protein DCC75_07170 [Pseudomonadota bacterium]
MSKRVFLLGIVCLGLSSCILAPAMDSFQKAGFTQADRARLLVQDVKKFHEALYWGDPGKAMSYVAEEGLPSVSQAIKDSRRNNERVIDSRIDYTDYTDGGYGAKVDVVVKYYKVPYYTVNERFETQTWEFSLVSGWKLVSRDIQAKG